MAQIILAIVGLAATGLVFMGSVPLEQAKSNLSTYTEAALGFAPEWLTPQIDKIVVWAGILILALLADIAFLWWCGKEPSSALAPSPLDFIFDESRFEDIQHSETDQKFFGRYEPRARTWFLFIKNRGAVAVSGVCVELAGSDLLGGALKTELLRLLPLRLKEANAKATEIALHPGQEAKFGLVEYQYGSPNRVFFKGSDDTLYDLTPDISDLDQRQEFDAFFQQASSTGISLKYAAYCDGHRPKYGTLNVSYDAQQLPTARWISGD
jgi:hypothetical protein